MAPGTVREPKLFPGPLFAVCVMLTGRILGRTTRPLVSIIRRDSFGRSSYHTSDEGVPMTRFILFLAGLLAMLAVVACGEPSPEQAITDSKPATAEPTKPAPTKIPVGLGVERDEVEDLFSASEIGFEFEDAPLMDGTARRMAEAPNGLASVELIGAESDLSRVSLFMAVSPETVNFNLAYSILVVTSAVPGWGDAEAMEWLSTSLQELPADSETTHGNARISLSASDDLSYLYLAVSAMDTDSDSATTNLSASAPTVPGAIASPTNTPAVSRPTPTQDIMKTAERLGSGVLLVGALGNGGVEPGTYEYRADDGNNVVQGNNCYLEVNRGDPAQERINAVAGQPFTYSIRHRHQYVSFSGYDGGCTGDSSVGYGLYRIGN